MRVKKGPEGAERKKRSLPRQKGHGRCAFEGPCDPLANKISRQNPGKGGDQPSALEALPLPLTRARGRGDPLCPLRRDHPLGLLENVWPQNKKGEKNKETPLPPRVPSKGASEGASKLEPRKFQKNPKNARGPEWHPENSQEAGRTAKKGDKPSAAGQKGEQEQTKTSACGGVLLLPDLCLSKEKTNKNKNNGEKPKEKRMNPKKADLTSRDFSKHFRERTAKT